MTFTASITRRDRKRRLRSGHSVIQTRWIVNFREPRSGRRKQLFFERQKDAIAKRDALLSAAANGTYSDSKTTFTVADALEHWLEHRRTEIKQVTLIGYRHSARYIVGPLMIGTARERKAYTEAANKPGGAQFAQMLGPSRIIDLTTGDIRSWHKTLTGLVSSHTANRAKAVLRSALALAAEDFHLRVPPMPLNLGRNRTRPKKVILTPEKVGCLLKAAMEDKRQGIYYAFPFLTGVRPSEQLALLWDDVDFDTGVIKICRMQERSGALSAITKTAAGMRDIPIPPLLKSMLLEWRIACPRLEGKLHRVFPAPGHIQPWSGPRKTGGGALHYSNFRNRYWRPVFIKLGLPYVTPHSARHAFISTLQSKGVEVGLVAKLAGHANAAITLSHYTQAVRGGEAAMEALEEAYVDGQ